MGFALKRRSIKGAGEESTAGFLTKHKQNSMNITQHNINGLFELEDDGTILHSRPYAENATAASGMVGRNFFDDVADIGDNYEFRRHFKNFIKSNKAAESFTLQCSTGKDAYDARILMTRGFQTAYCPPTGVVMLEIKNL